MELEAGPGKERGMTNERTGGAANVLRPSIDDVILASQENATVEEGLEHERQREEGEGQQGDWWREEMANGKVAANTE